MALWQLPAEQLQEKLGEKMADLFGVPAVAASVLAAPIAVGQSVAERGPWVAGGAEPCSACGASFPATGRSSRLCVYCGKSSAVSPASLVPPFRGSLIYTNLFDALGMAPPPAALALPPSPNHIADGHTNGDDSDTPVPSPATFSHTNAAAPSPAHAMAASAATLTPARRASDVSADSKPAPAAAAAQASPQQSGSTPKAAFGTVSPSALDFFASGGAGAAASTTATAGPSTSPTSSSQTTATKTTAPAAAPANDLDWLQDAAVASSPQAAQPAATAEAEDDDDDFAPFASHQTPAGAVKMPAPAAAAAIPAPADAGDDVGDDDDFADFSSAPAQMASPIAVFASPAPAVSFGAGAPTLEFTVQAAPPSRGEMALKRITELAQALPDLSFLARTL